MSKKLSFLSLCIIAIGSVYWAFQLPKLQYDYNIENFFPLGSEETEFFNRYRAVFGSDNDFTLIAIKPHTGIFNKAFLTKLNNLSEELSKIPTITQVLSLSNVKEYKYYSAFNKARAFPFLHINNPDKYAQDSLKIFESKNLPGFLISPDRSSVLIYAENKPYLDVAGCKSLKEEMQKAIGSYDLGTYYISGKCLGQSIFIETIQYEIKVFTLASIFLIVLILFYVFKGLFPVILPLLVVSMAVLWTLGIMITLGRPVSMISNMIPSMLLIIGVSDVIHLISQFINLQEKGIDRNRALKMAIKKVGTATILTSITTILGFLSLFSTRFALLRELGLFASLGVFFALIMTYAIVPPVIRYLPKITWTSADAGEFLDKQLLLLFHWMDKRKKQIVRASFLLLGISALVATYLQVNVFLLTDIKEDHPLRQDFAYISEHFGGSRPHSIHIQVKDSSLHIFSPQVLQEIQQVESYLLDEYGFKKIRSPLSQLKAANQVFHAGRSTYYKIPDSVALIGFLSQQLREKEDPFIENIPLDQDIKIARLNGLLPDLGSRVVLKKDQQFFQFIKEKIPNAYCEYHITGTAHLMELNSEFLASDIVIGLLFALAGIGLFMGLILKSFRMVLIALLPNILPLLCLAAILVLFGISLKISTSIIFLIALGICVDDSIHFLSHFQQERKNHSLYQSVKNSYLETGKAIVLTSAILSAGFLVLCLSSFLGTFYIGALVAISMVLALLADLLFLPALLLLFLKD